MTEKACKAAETFYSVIKIKDLLTRCINADQTATISKLMCSFVVLVDIKHVVL